MSDSFLMKRKSNARPASSGNEGQETGVSASVLSDQLLKSTAKCFLAWAMPGNCFSFPCSTENGSRIYGSGPDNTCQAEGEAAAAVEELPSCTDGGGQRQFSSIWFFPSIHFFPNKQNTSSVLALKDLQPFRKVGTGCSEKNDQSWERSGDQKRRDCCAGV